jgi:hypothetical protein
LLHSARAAGLRVEMSTLVRASDTNIYYWYDATQLFHHG